MYKSGRVFLILSACALASAQASAATDWLQFGFDPSHSGINPDETLLTPQNVKYLTLLYSKTLSTPAEGTPVLLTAVSTAQGVKDLLFLTLEDGTLLALDAATGTQIWIQSPPTTPACAFDSPPCVTTSSPAIDPNRQFVYSFSRADGKIHKFAVATGAETVDTHWPEVSTTKPDVEKGSSALVFATAVSDGNTYLYMSNSSIQLNDGGDYQGHLTAIDLGSGTQVVFNVVCSNLGNIHFVENGTTTGANPDDCAQQTIPSGDNNAGDPTGNGGVWGRAAAAYDPANDDIYISTGNGTFDATHYRWGDSVLKLPAALSAPLYVPLDLYTPSDYLSLMENDNDLGSASIALIPTSLTQAFAYKHLGIQSGKDSNLRILDLDNMGITNGPGAPLDDALFTQAVAQGNEVKTQVMTWVNPADNAVLIIAANDFGISAAHLIMDGSGNPQFTYTSGWALDGGSLSHGTPTGGASPVIANDVLYYAGAAGLVALDPATGTVLVTKTEMGVSTSSPGNFHKQSPVVVNNRVYITDENSNLWVYQGDEIFKNGFE
jgi:outer membrane protein assembly factor BamB